MREILFRGKSVNDLKWVEGFYVREAGHFIKELPSAVTTPIHLVYPETVGQFTGLTDKNGKKIFEGDVVKVLQDKDKGVAYVGFENGAFMLYPRTGNIYERTLWAYWYNDWDVEIIGNIHDNAELLKGEE